ncbi:PQQ-dependent sugar dehydrogenase [Naasia lichenicola]|uniref:PQQ-dependent sugar dehydrogenase n=1 Tax=Naasia lichenicola TaxID=2565933 RepID=A0A4S4FIH3_9MICO|nr:PQQ-dependent sugar dehydrogenase [Naasia lichenicola]THG29642.1 PQQ-dependent sugar dehydrogenase [Naasia lichenicola]
MRRAITAASAALAMLLLAACSDGGRNGGSTDSTPAPLPSTTATPSTGTPLGALQPAGTPTDLATGLDVPWSVLPVEGGSTLIGERDNADVQELTAAGTLQEVAPVAGVVPGGEGGLLGLELLESDGGPWLYAYYTSADDNRIVRMHLDGAPGAFRLGEQEIILDGLAKAGNHNGGRIAFGPDGMLYATVGDAGDTSRSQDLGSLNGKILRMTPTGEVPEDNPFDASLVWSYGHRNPQGITWAEDGTMFAAEFGQDTWDELNRIVPGANYGWPIVEGIGDADAASGTGSGSDFTDPIYQWSTDDASPSGLVAIGDTLFMAGLGGERLWVIQGAIGQDAADDDLSVSSYFSDYGRIRDVLAAADGSLWFLTNNTGRGSPRDGDDRLVRIALAPV